MSEHTVAQIVEIPLSELKQAENNLKKHTNEQIAQIAQSIIRFGFRDPIAVTEDYTILEGHGRVAACRSLGMDSIPAYVRPLSEDRATMYAYLHNKLTLDTTMDNEAAMRQMFAGQSEEQAMADAALCGFSDVEVSLYAPEAVDTSKVYFGSGVGSAAERALTEVQQKRVILSFMNQAEYDLFTSFLAKLRAAYPAHSTHAERLLAYIDSYAAWVEGQ